MLNLKKKTLYKKFFPNWSTDSMQLQWKFQHYLQDTDKLILNLHGEAKDPQ